MLSPSSTRRLSAVNNLTLLVVDLIVLQQVFTDYQSCSISIFICAFSIALESILCSICSFSCTPRALEDLHHLLRAEQTHQIIFQRNVEAGFSRVSLTSGTTTQLIVDTS